MPMGDDGLAGSLDNSVVRDETHMMNQVQYERMRAAELDRENNRLRNEIALLNEMLDSAHTRLERAKDLCSRASFCGLVAPPKCPIRCPLHPDLLCDLHDSWCAEPACAGPCDCFKPRREREHEEAGIDLDELFGFKISDQEL